MKFISACCVRLWGFAGKWCGSKFAVGESARTPLSAGMFLRAVAVVLSVLFLAGCPQDRKDPKKAQGKKETMKDQNGDTSFQAFLGRLRKAVETRDKVGIASMLAPDFGYRWDKGPEGETPFAYWDRHKLWGTLASVMRERWTPHEGFMVAPPQFAENESYPGYRAGLTMVNGSWRFAYFVGAPGPGDGSQSAPAPEEQALPSLPQ